jgi:hypothetical protein
METTQAGVVAIGGASLLLFFANFPKLEDIGAFCYLKNLLDRH